MSDREAISQQYQRRFSASAEYRDLVWRAINQAVLGRYVDTDAAILDLGCGWGEFICNIDAASRYAMDLNPDSAAMLGSKVNFLEQDCSKPWSLEDNALDVVFTSNFLEHLPTKSHIEDTLDQVRRCLKPHGRIILIGPNIRYVPGAYWDFWDHHIALSERSVVELLELKGFSAEEVVPRFLPYTMSNGAQPPLSLVKLYLRLPFLWPLLGKQFMVVAKLCD